MVYYIGNMPDNTPNDMKRGSATPAAHHLFDIAEDVTKVSPAGADVFNYFMVQLLYQLKRAHQYLQLSVLFLCTIVRDIDTDDYKKLVRVIKYTQGAIGLPVIL